MKSVIKEKNESCNIFFFENGCCICMYYCSCINISSVNNYRAIKPLAWQRIYIYKRERKKMNYIMFQKNIPTFEILLRCLFSKQKAWNINIIIKYITPCN